MQRSMNDQDLLASSSDEGKDGKELGSSAKTGGQNSKRKTVPGCSIKDLFGDLSDDSDDGEVVVIAKHNQDQALKKGPFDESSDDDDEGVSVGGHRTPQRSARLSGRAGHRHQGVSTKDNGQKSSARKAPTDRTTASARNNNVNFEDLFAESSDSEEEGVNTKNHGNFRRKKPRVVLPEHEDKEKALEAMKLNGRWLCNRSDRLRDDEDVVLAAIEQCPQALQFASDRLKGDPKTVLRAATTNKCAGAEAMQCASPDLLQKDRNFLLSLTNTNPKCYRHLPCPTLKDDKEIALAAIEKFADNVTFASERLKLDRDVVQAAASGSWLETMLKLGKCGSKHKWDTQNKEIVLKAVRSKGTLFRFASAEIRADREVVVAAIESGNVGGRPCLGRSVSCWLGDCLAEELLADRALNLLAAQTCGCFLNAELCKQDREIVMAGVSKNRRLFWQLPEASRADRETAMAALRADYEIYSALPMSLKRDYEVAMAAVSNGGCELLPDMAVEWRGNRNIVLAALDGYEGGGAWSSDADGSPPDWFRSASVELRSDPFIVLKAVKKNGLFLRDVVLNGTRDVEIVKAAIANDAHALRHVPSERLSGNPYIVAEALRGIQSYFEDEEEGLDYIREHAGESLMEKLVAINHEYELGEGNSDKTYVSEHQDVAKWSREWKKVLWHKVWLLGKLIPNDARAKVLQFADILPDFRLARKIAEVGPLVEASAKMDLGVDDLVKSEEA